MFDMGALRVSKARARRAGARASAPATRAPARRAGLSGLSTMSVPDRGWVSSGLRQRRWLIGPQTGTTLTQAGHRLSR